MYRNGRSLIALVTAIRAPEWGVHYFTFLLVAAMCCLVSNASWREYFGHVSGLSLYLILVLPFAYMLNDVFDKKHDEQQGKQKLVWRVKTSHMIAVLVVLSSSAVAIMYLWFRRLDILMIVLVQIAIAVAYSAKPLRLKERGWSGIIAAAGGQRLPQFVVLVLVADTDVAAAVSVCVWLFLLGLLFIIEHQMDDWLADSAAGVKTLVVNIGRARAHALRTATYCGFVASGMIFIVVPISTEVTWHTALFRGGFLLMTVTSVVALRYRYQHQPCVIHREVQEKPAR